MSAPAKHAPAKAPVPTRFASQNEALAWAQIMGRHGSRYHVHRRPDGHLRWVAELLPEGDPQ